MLKQLLNLIRSMGKGHEGPNEGKDHGPLSPRLDDNLRVLREIFRHASDLVIKDIRIGGRKSRAAAVVYLDDIVDPTRVEQAILQPLMVWARPAFWDDLSDDDLIQQISTTLMVTAQTGTVRTLNEVVSVLLDGDPILLIDGVGAALMVEGKGFPKREISLHTSEVSVRGPQDGFTETAVANVALVRRRLKTDELAVEQLRIGRKSRTDVRLLYIAGMAPEPIVSEIRRRLEGIDIDLVNYSRTVQGFLSDHPYTIFPTIRATERPDTVASSLANGRVALIVDNDPFALIMPTEVHSFFATAEHYNVGPFLGSAFRLITMVALVLSVLLTPLYVALTTYHQELIPLPLLLNIAITEAAVPFPVGVTAFVVEVVLEILREAGARLPSPIGQAASIVGAIVLGQAAIEAAFVSPGLIIVAATAAIASFAVPSYEVTTSFRLCRFPALILAAVLGFYGVALATVIVVFHMASLKSFGVPYLTLYTPGRVSELTEKMIVVPERLRRPVRSTAAADRTRRGDPPSLRDPDEASSGGGKGGRG